MIFNFIISFRSGKKKAQSLMVVTVQATDIPPKETVLYTKQTQTTQAGTDHVRDGKTIFYLSLKLSLKSSSLVSITRKGNNHPSIIVFIHLIWCFNF